MLFSDGEWTDSAENYHSQEFLAWLFNDSQAPKDIVVNDRWGIDTRSKHGGYYTSEYGKVDVHGTELSLEKPWEENRGIGGSFGYNRNENIEDYLTSQQAVHLLIDVVSSGGNLLLNVGPTADGRIPTIMEVAETPIKTLQKRNNVEATIFQLGYHYSNAKTRYRGEIKHQMWANIRCLWINFVRILKYIEQLCQRTLFFVKFAIRSLLFELYFTIKLFLTTILSINLSDSENTQFSINRENGVVGADSNLNYEKTRFF